MEAVKIVFIVLVSGSCWCTGAPIFRTNMADMREGLIYVSPTSIDASQESEGAEESPELVYDPEAARDGRLARYITQLLYGRNLYGKNLYGKNFLAGSAVPEKDDVSVEDLGEVKSRSVRSVVDGGEVVGESGKGKLHDLRFRIPDNHHHLYHDHSHHHPNVHFLHHIENDAADTESIEVESANEGGSRLRRSVEEVVGEEAEQVEPADAEGRHRFRHHSSNYASSNSFGGGYQGGFGHQNQYGVHGIHDNNVLSHSLSHSQTHSNIIDVDQGHYGFGGGNSYGVLQGGYPVGYNLNPVGYGQSGFAQSSYAQSGGYGQPDYYGGNVYGGYRPGHASSSAFASAQSNVH